jgi:hypothetical protein
MPTNITMLGAHFGISSNGRNPFKKQKAWGNKAKKDKEEFKDPIVYFTLAIATDEDPKEILARIIHEWQHRGGILLRIKELQSFESKTVLALFSICTAVPKKLILDKFCTILAQAQSFTQEDDNLEFNWNPEELPQNSTLPAMEICMQNPKLPGQDTSDYSKLSWRVQANHKVYNVECDRKFATNIKQLAQVAKEANFLSKMWGKHAHVTKVVNKLSTPSKIKCLIMVSQRHMNYQCSMLVEDVQGITNLDVPVGIYQEGSTKCLGHLSLQQAMLEYMKMSNGHPAHCGGSASKLASGPSTHCYSQLTRSGENGHNDQQEPPSVCWTRPQGPRHPRLLPFGTCQAVVLPGHGGGNKPISLEPRLRHPHHQIRRQDRQEQRGSEKSVVVQGRICQSGDSGKRRGIEEASPASGDTV